MLESATSSPKVRDRAMFVLAQSGSPEARQALVASRSRARIPSCRRRRSSNLGLFGGHESRQSLVRDLRDSQNIEARKAVLQAFMLGGDRGRLLEVARKETSPELRREAINQLGVSGGREELWQLYQQEKDVQVRKRHHQRALHLRRRGSAERARDEGNRSRASA